MKSLLVNIALGLSLCAFAQESPKVRVEKRIMVIKDGQVFQSPSDSLLKGLHIEIDSAFGGAELDLAGLAGNVGDRMMVFRSNAPSGPMLGVRIAATEGVRGVTVQSVEPISTAAAMGLQVGDVIASVNGTSVSEPKDLVELIRGLEVGSAVDVRFRRDGKSNRMKGYLIPGGGNGALPSWVEGEPIRIELKEQRADREF